MSIEEIIPDESNVGWNRILSSLNNSFLDQNDVPKLDIIKAYQICNRTLEDSYKNKVNEFVANGCKGSELETKIGFVVENDCKEISELMQSGVAVRDSDNNTIGYNCMGVYLCKHLDVCLKYALAKMSSVDHYKIIICQYITGKTTTAIPRAAVMGEFIEPTPNFTSHISTIPPSPRDSIQAQFDRSQVYLYELDDKSCPMLTPRQVIPLWVVVYGGLGVGRGAGGDVMEKRGLDGYMERDENIARVDGIRGMMDGGMGRLDGLLNRGMGGIIGNTQTVRNLEEMKYKNAKTTNKSDGIIGRLEGEMSQIVNPTRVISSNLRLQRVIDHINSRGQPEQPSKLQMAIDNINYKGQPPQPGSMMEPLYEGMVDEIGGNYDGKPPIHLSNHPSTLHPSNRLSNHHLVNQNHSLTNPNQQLINQILANQFNQINSQNLSNANLSTFNNQQLNNAQLTNQNLTSDDYFSSLNLLQNLNEPLFYCSDTNNILDVNSLLALAGSSQNIATLLPINQSPDISTQQQQQQDYYPVNYFNNNNKAFQQPQQQEMMYAPPPPSSHPMQNMKKRGSNDASPPYHHVYDKKVRIM